MLNSSQASAVDDLTYLEEHLNKMKLCGELGKLMSITDNQLLINEELRLAMYPHIPVTDIKIILSSYVYSRPELGFTMIKVDDICRQIEKQKMIHYPFQAPFIHGEELSDKLRACQLTKIPRYTFSQTPFYDKVYLN